jgi:4-hydroxybenzoate polyprenyltransferase
LIAGGSVAEAATLMLAMAGFQASIGALNDLHDRADDAIGQPWKAIPSGRVAPGTARWVVVASGAVGSLGSFVLGPAPLLVGLGGYGLGVAYDLGLKRTPWGWACFALALPLVPVYAWLGVGAGLPPNVGILIVLGGLAGTELAIANGLVDAATDADIGTGGVVVRLGWTRARLVMVATALGTLSVAWLSTLIGAGHAGPDERALLQLVASVIGTVALLAGVAMSLRGEPTWSWRGWHLQALGVAMLALTWILAAS